MNRISKIHDLVSFITYDRQAFCVTFSCIVIVGLSRNALIEVALRLSRSWGVAVQVTCLPGRRLDLFGPEGQHAQSTMTRMSSRIRTKISTAIQQLDHVSAIRR